MSAINEAVAGLVSAILAVKSAAAGSSANQ